MKQEKLLLKIISGTKNIQFNDIVNLVEAFGFRLSRIKGSHHIYVHSDIPELVNFQNVNGKAKPYQVKQFLKLVERYDLELKEK